MKIASLVVIILTALVLLQNAYGVLVVAHQLGGPLIPQAVINDIKRLHYVSTAVSLISLMALVYLHFKKLYKVSIAIGLIVLIYLNYFINSFL